MATLVNTFLRRYPHLVALALVTGWNFLLIIYRVKVTGRGTFIFLLWNLFLAIVPFLAAEMATLFAARDKRTPAIALVLLSILFLPNAPYIITDLFHLRERNEMPMWYDTMLLFSFALSGLLLFYVGLLQIREVLHRFWGYWIAELVVVSIAFLSSFGIYLGRYLRFNSWDVLSNPNDLFEEIANRVISPSRHTQTVGVTLLYGAFLLTGYWVVRLYRYSKPLPPDRGVQR